MGNYTTYNQHEPLRVPEGWDAGEKRLISQLEEILDDIYRRFGRLKLTDLTETLRTTIIDTGKGVTELTVEFGEITARVEDAEGNVSVVQQTVEGLTSIVSSKNRTFAQSTAPTEGMVAGDLWINTDDGNKLYRYSGSAWSEVQDTHLDAMVTSHTTQISQLSSDLVLKASQTDLDTLTGRVMSAESAITLHSDEIALKVSKNGVISAINQSAETVAITASKINLNGVVTANNNFKILTDGSAEMYNAKLSGSLEADITYCNNLQCRSGKKIRVGNCEINPNTMVLYDGSTEGLSFTVEAGQGGLISSSKRLFLVSSILTNLLGNVYINSVKVPKIVMGTTYSSSGTGGYMNYSDAGFTSAPYVIAAWASTGGNVSGAWGALKIYSKTASGAYAIAGGSLPSSTQPVDWIAVGW